MDSEQIIKLLDAGYTKADIDKMEAKPDEQKSGSPDSAAGTETAGDPDGKKEEVKKEETVTQDATIKALSETVAQLTETVKAMQANNINGATGGKTETKTVDEVMKSFIETL